MSFKVETKRFVLNQNKSQAFNTDTILLSNFLKVPKGAKNILDVGTGSGVLMLDLSFKTNALIYGIEVQENRYLKSLENIKENNLEDRLFPLLGNFKDYKFDVLFDMIISNPPFFKVNNDLRLSEDIEDRIARHEVLINLEELIESVSKNLKYRGVFYLVHRPDRLEEIIYLFNKYNLTLKEVRFVHPYINSDANHVLIKAIKNGNSGMIVLNPLILYEEKHVFSNEMKKIIGDF